MRPEETISNEEDEVFIKDKVIESEKIKEKEEDYLLQKALIESGDLSKPKHYHHPDYVHEEENTAESNYRTAKEIFLARHKIDRSSLVDYNHDKFGPKTGSWYTGWNTDDDDDEAEIEEQKRREKQKKTEEEIKKLKCSLGEMYLKQQEYEEKRQARCELDPRLASRSPNANTETQTKLRYDVPVYASPSRTLKDVRTKAANSELPPITMSCTQVLTTVNNSSTVANDCESASAVDLRSPPELSIPKGMSMPDVRNYPMILPYKILKTTNKRRPKGVIRSSLEKHLSDVEFQKIFKMAREQFYALPHWRQVNLKKENHLF